jgi:hypothetical protein
MTNAPADLLPARRASVIDWLRDVVRDALRAEFQK